MILTIIPQFLLILGFGFYKMMRKIVFSLLLLVWSFGSIKAYSGTNKIVENEDPYLQLATNILSYAKRFRGTPYRYGGTRPGGFDCSGYVRFVFAKFKMEIPHSSRELAAFGYKVEKPTALPGDLIFFGYKNHVNHVGIVVSANENEVKFIHSSTTNGVVISSTNEDYYAKTFISVRRVLDTLKNFEYP